MKYLWLTILFFIPFAALAQDSISSNDFLLQLMGAFSHFGGLSSFAKFGLIITLLISSMKVSFLDDLIWNKLGKMQIWIAPILGLIGGLIAIPASGGQLSFANIMAFISAGAGAIFFHEILDLIKVIPGLGVFYVGIIDVIESHFGGNPNSPESSALQPPKLK